MKEKIKKMASKVEEENFDGDLEMVRNLFYDVRSWKQKKKICYTLYCASKFLNFLKMFGFVYVDFVLIRFWTYELI